MRMLVTLEFADAGSKSGTHRVLMMGRGIAFKTRLFAFHDETSQRRS